MSTFEEDEHLWTDSGTDAPKGAQESQRCSCQEVEIPMKNCWSDPPKKIKEEPDPSPCPRCEDGWADDYALEHGEMFFVCGECGHKWTESAQDYLG